MTVAFLSGASSVTLSGGPSAPRNTAISKTQPRGFSLGGRFYLYDRGVTIVEHRLLFSRQPKSVVDQVAAFFDSDVRGAMTQFIFREGDSDRLVTLASALETREQYPGRYLLALTLRELIYPSGTGLVDSFDQSLLDSDGNIILGV